VDPFRFLKREHASTDEKPSSDDRVVALLHMSDRACDGFRLAEKGAYRESNEVLESLLADLEHAHGPAVDDVRGKLLGLVGTNYWHLGNLERSRAFTVEALLECRRIGDGIGVRTYRTNLRFLNNEPISNNPRMIALEIDVLKQLTRSQRLSDQSLCKESNELLEGISRAKGSEQSLIIDRYRGKINGLIGENYFVLGNSSMAQRYTEAAINDCRRFGDEDGVRIYTHNLEAITRSAASAPRSPA
jgi:hypothetical protein